VAEQSLERSRSAQAGWQADAHPIHRSVLTEVGIYTLQRLPSPPVLEGKMDELVRSRNTGSTRALSGRRGGQRTKFNDRGRGAGPPTNSQASMSLPPNVDRAGALLASIYVQQITLETLLNDEKPAIRDCQYVASYNWLDKKTPTILVPGKANLFHPPPQTANYQTHSRLATSLPPAQACTYVEARQWHVLQRPQCSAIPSIPSRAGDPRTFNFQA
jgi:hypothetical protein